MLNLNIKGNIKCTFPSPNFFANFIIENNAIKVGIIVLCIEGFDEDILAQKSTIHETFIDLLCKSKIDYIMKCKS